MISPHRSALFNVAVTVLAFGGAPFFKKLAIEGGTSSWSVALVTVTFAVATSLLIARVVRPAAIRELIAPAHIVRLVVIGVLATGIVTLLVAEALTSTTATNRSLFQAAYPAATLILAHGFLNERLRLFQYLLMTMMMLGLLLMNGAGGDVRFGKGFWLLALTLPLIGFGDVFGKRLATDLSPLLVATGRAVYGTVFVACVVPFLGIDELPGLANLTWLALAGICQALGVWTLYRALRATKASLISSLVAAAPLVTAAAEFLFLDLTLHAYQWVGVALVVCMAAWLALTLPQRDDDQEPQTQRAASC